VPHPFHVLCEKGGKPRNPPSSCEETPCPILFTFFVKRVGNHETHPIETVKMLLAKGRVLSAKKRFGWDTTIMTERAWGFTGCGKTLQVGRNVKGHDFSRAVTVSKESWALAPAGAPPMNSIAVRRFSAACSAPRNPAHSSLLKNQLRGAAAPNPSRREGKKIAPAGVPTEGSLSVGWRA
jgi:hypothetical protein